MTCTVVQIVKRLISTPFLAINGEPIESPLLLTWTRTILVQDWFHYIHWPDIAKQNLKLRSVLRIIMLIDGKQ